MKAPVSKNYRSKRKRMKMRAQAHNDELKRQQAAAESNDPTSQAPSTQDTDLNEAGSGTAQDQNHEVAERLESLDQAVRDELADDDGSDGAFEELFASYEQQMVEQCLQNIVRKLKPNVSVGWLKSVKKQLDLIEKREMRALRAKSSATKASK